jgi:hypothetical protein
MIEDDTYSQQASQSDGGNGQKQPLEVYSHRWHITPLFSDCQHRVFIDVSFSERIGSLEKRRWEVCLEFPDFCELVHSSDDR